MARGFPSMTALLGLLAVAGFQNRDKIAEMLRGQAPGTRDDTRGDGGRYAPAGVPAGQGMGGLGGMLGSLGGLGAGGFLSGGLREIIERFTQNGQTETVESWVGTGPNRPIESTSLQQVIGPDMLEALATQTGLSQQDILQRLTRELPDAVDRYTPGGELPRDDDEKPIGLVRS